LWRGLTAHTTKKRFEDDGKIVFKETDDGQEDMTATDKKDSE